MYLPSSNTFVFKSAGYGSGAFEMMTIVHESTHAVIDARKRKTLMLANENLRHMSRARCSTSSAKMRGCNPSTAARSLGRHLSRGASGRSRDSRGSFCDMSGENCQTVHNDELSPL
jgi:hypothetical protein